MLRFSTIIWMIGVAVAASGLYMVKYKVQALHEQVAQVERQLRDEKEAVHVLEAEWTYLNRPDRLRRLSAKYLEIVPADPKQIAEYDAIPMRGEQQKQLAERQPSLPLTKASAIYHIEH